MVARGTPSALLLTVFLQVAELPVAVAKDVCPTAGGGRHADQTLAVGFLQLKKQLSALEQGFEENGDDDSDDDDDSVHDHEVAGPQFDDESESSHLLWVWIPNGRAWRDSQCPLLANLPQHDVLACKKACLNNERCFAFNHNEGARGCELRACTPPVGAIPDWPNEKRTGWKAFYRRLMADPPCYPGETLQRLSDGGHNCRHPLPKQGPHLEPEEPSFWWDRPLPRFDGCWQGMGDGKLKEFTWAIKLTKRWADHFHANRVHFERHGYPTLELSPRIFLDKVSYLYEQQFGVRLTAGDVGIEQTLWKDGYAGIVRFDTQGRGNSPGGALCQRREMLGAANGPFDNKGNFNPRGMFVLAHEMGHYFGSQHAGLHKPDIMVQNGRATYRRCRGRPCLYQSFHKMRDATDYLKTICKNNIQKAKCARLATTQPNPPPTQQPTSQPTPAPPILGAWLVLKGKQTSQSSTTDGGVSSRAVDGNTDSNWRGRSCTHTDRQSSPWWKVSLGQSYKVYAVRITNRGDCCGSRLRRFQLLVSGQSCGMNLRVSQGETKKFSCNGLVGSEIKVQSQLRDVLTLCEVEVMAEMGPKWLSLTGMETSQSGTRGGGVSARAVDGNRDSNWGGRSCTHTDWRSSPWWKVSLGQRYKVYAVRVTNRGDCCGSRLRRFRLLVSGQSCGTSLQVPQGETKEFSCNGLVGSEITVQSQLQGVLTLCEVEVMAEPA